MRVIKTSLNILIGLKQTTISTSVVFALTAQERNRLHVPFWNSINQQLFGITPNITTHGPRISTNKRNGMFSCSKLIKKWLISAP